MTITKSNEVLQANMEVIQADIKEIKEKLDTKYVSHETFELTLKTLTTRFEIQEREVASRFDFALKMAIILGTPIYGAVITLLFKTFS